MIEIQPTGDYPIPFDLSDEQPRTHKDSIAIAANTANLIEELGGNLDYADTDLHKAAELIEGTAKPTAPRHITKPAEAKAAALLIEKFDFQAFADVQQARNFVTNKLLMLADCGDPKLEIRALELLGKHSDIGLFSERSEITVTHRSSNELENSIKERIKRLLHADVVDVEPLISELEAEKTLPAPEKPEKVENLEEDEENGEETGG